MNGYRGRFAPSPTGPLHAGSLVAALASWLDARAHGGQWLVRIEDVDRPRCVAGADQEILRQLASCGFVPDEAPVWQSQRDQLYQAALDRLVAAGDAYPCACSRKDIEEALRALGRERARHGELVYPGTCRGGLQGRAARAWRFRVDGGVASRTHPTNIRPCRVGSRSDPTGIDSDGRVRSHSASTPWHDRRLGPQTQDVAQVVGDFVLKRADGLFAYQLAVVVDDADQRITHVVRGEDLADNTARQLLLQRALGFPALSYLHTTLVLGARGEKLSKQNGAAALDLRDPLAALQAAAGSLRLHVPAGTTLPDWLNSAVRAWAAQWTIRG